MLSSWKEIALFFGKGVRTVQRWEKTLDLPIHRPPGAPSNVVLARTTDLEEWMHRGQPTRTSSDHEDAATESVPRMLASLEHEVRLLAETTGVSTGSVLPGSSTADRVSVLAETVAQVNERMSSGRTARAA